LYQRISLAQTVHTITAAVNITGVTNETVKNIHSCGAF